MLQQQNLIPNEGPLKFKTKQNIKIDHCLPQKLIAIYFKPWVIVTKQNNFFKVHGPPNTPYEGYSFRIQVIYTLGYPFDSPPQMRFLDIPWNPFFDPETGEIYCDILYQNWTPALTIEKTLLSIVSLISQTKIDEGVMGLNIEATAEMIYKFSTFYQRAKKKAQERHYKKENFYKKEQFPPPQIVKDIENDQVSFEFIKKQFMNDPVNRLKHNQKKQFVKNFIFSKYQSQKEQSQKEQSQKEQS